MDELTTYLQDLKGSFSSEDVLLSLSKLKDLKVLVIGDVIIDEYAFCNNLERAKKEPILVFQHMYSEHYAGGILAIANHVAEFSDNVTLVTQIGNDTLIDHVLNVNLNKKIKREFFKDPSYPTLNKKRYISSYTASKVFEVYNKEPDLLNLRENEILKYLTGNLELFDIVIVGDFGHGFITDKIKNVLCNRAKYLAVNVQTNSGNIGFNLITKFKRADYISLTAEELQLALHDKKSSLKKLIRNLSLRTKCKKISITLGKNGLLYFDNWKFYYAPVLSNSVLDTVGAGDAVFSATSLAARSGFDPKLVPFIGNCMGALAIKISGNKEPVRAERLNSFIKLVFNQDLNSPNFALTGQDKNKDYDKIL